MTPMESSAAVRRLTAVTDADIEGLAGVLIDCVQGGASVSFMSPLPKDKAVAFWRGIAAQLADGRRALLVAEDSQGIVGTVQLVFDLPENQPHRTDLSKMLVHRRARRRGVGEVLLHAAEDLARDNGRTLLVLDTASDEAARLYARAGWTRVGTVPGFALWPEGGLCDTTFFYRTLTPPAP
jgi:GNAT superfamily N-acetyltransferase